MVFFQFLLKCVKCVVVIYKIKSINYLNLVIHFLKSTFQEKMIQLKLHIPQLRTTIL